jgi:hypothetical protein
VRPGEISVAEIAARLGEDPAALLRALDIRGRVEGNEFWGAPTSAGGPGDSFVMVLSGRKRGKWYHHGEGGLGAAKGDGVDLVIWHRGVSKGEAVKWAKGWLGIEEGKPLPPRRAPAIAEDPAELDNARRRLERARGIWGHAKPIEGTPAELYLRGRGILLAEWPETLRFHPSVKYPYRDGTFPALICLVQDVVGAFAGIWRIYLSPDGRKLQGVDKPKLGLGDVRGGAVRLQEPTNATRIGLSEGVETGLAVAARFPALAFYACLSTGGIIGAELPRDYEEAIVFADLDAPIAKHPWNGRRPGTVAAETACARFRREGRRASILYPGTGDDTDFNDALRGAA